MKSPQTAILREGRNCWRVCNSDRSAVLVDGEIYFAHLHDALQQARRSILILGWDFDGRIKLRPQDAECLTLGAMLRELVEKNSGLSVDILVWSVAVWHAPSSPAGLLLGESWQEHPRIRVHLDTQHPIYAAHHQKIICIDESLAFCGGMDLTVMRWDSTDHRVDEPLRRDPEGAPYGPVHDIQMVVQGEAAMALADIARERWRRAKLPPPAKAEWGEPVWPRELLPDFASTPIALARTFPLWEDHGQIEEIATLTRDVILAGAHLYLYREPVSHRSRCGQGAGQETRRAQRTGRGHRRHQAVARPRRTVCHGPQPRAVAQAPAFAPTATSDCASTILPFAMDADESPIHVHAKLMIVDDRVLRVGSANLNNRSMGLDTECDLVIEAHDEATQREICRIRERLMAEHLGTTPAVARETAIAERSLLTGIERLNHSPRQLKDIRVKPRGPIRPVWATLLLDPRRPIKLLGLLQRGVRGLRWPALPRIQHYFRQGQKG